jgi:NAD(P)-dependent dehydrogenase (short-subunit alcohol dehydrogenase family)
MALVRAACVVALLVAALLALQRVPVPDPARSAVLITGTSTGIGRHAALDLACRHHYLVFATVRTEAHAASLRGEATSGGCGAFMHPVLMDVTVPETVALARGEVAAVLASSGRTLAAVVTNAGISTMGACTSELARGPRP